MKEKEQKNFVRNCVSLRCEEKMEETMEGNEQAWEVWLNLAVGGIRFKPDRAAVRAELEAHLEDKKADLCRIFPDMTREEAETRAVESMGDAWQVREPISPGWGIYGA